MQITSNKFNIYNYPAKRNVNFKGHVGCDMLKEGSKVRRLTTETAFFRDYNTLKFSVNYINDIFRNIKEKRFLVGGCSSGEEVWSLKMLMGNNPVKIVGFDPSAKEIENARKGIYEISVPKGDKEKEIIDKFGASGFKDYYLGFDDVKLTEEEKKLKQLFNSMFEDLKSGSRIIYGLKECMRKIFDISFIEFKRMPFKLKNPGQKDCEFLVGDIRDLEQVNGNNKNQLFSFRNALYHITTNNNAAIRYPYCSDEVLPQLDMIFKKVNAALMKKGLFILGENEHEQGGDMAVVFEALLKNGFIPININSKQPYYNIWMKTKDIL